jgi:hypothetical protein
MGLTLVLLVVLEVISATVFPLIGIEKYQIPFNILIVLYLSFKLDSPYLALLILLVQYFHSLFSIEGWAIGTFIGVLISRIIYLFKETVEFFAFPLVIIVVQVSFLLWLIFSSMFVYFGNNSFAPVWSRFWIFIPESIIASLLSPLLFMVLEKIWKQDEEASLRGVN